MTRAKTQRPRTRDNTLDDRPSRRALSERQATIERAREERHVMLERAPRLDSSLGEPLDALDVADAIDALDDDVEFTELPAPRQLSIAIHESASYLAAAQHAIAASGHVVAKGASGRGGLDDVKQLLAAGSIDVLLVGIPAGEPIIDAALALAPHRPIVIAATTGTATDVVRKAAAAGADLATVRPYDVTSLAPVLLAASRLADERRALVNAKGSESVLRARLAQLSAPEPGTLQPFELFQRVLELELKRAKRYAYPIAVALFAVEVSPPAPPAGVRGILRARAGNALIHSIRDIDLATELDHERFLVLLPYTDLTGGSEVARRIIRAVSACDPVVMAGRTFPPRVTGAVSGAKPGQQLSFAKLMRDATRALEDARRDGAESAVQPVIRGSTRLVAVIGWPIAHSRSPQMINAGFAAEAIDAVMVPIGVPPEGFATVVAGLREMRALGASVTTPHKLAAVGLCDELSADAREIGAVNCLHVDGARLVGHNTDAAGFIDGLAGAGFDVAGKLAVVLGAGGAARAVVHGLASVGARAQVIARAPASVAWTRATPWSTAQLRDAFAHAELVVDCTPIALGAGEADAIAALPLDALAPGAWVATLVYHRATILLERARERGHSTVDGRAMLVHQGARAFTTWTGCPAPVARMAESLDASLLDSC